MYSKKLVECVPVPHAVQTNHLASPDLIYTVWSTAGFRFSALVRILLLTYPSCDLKQILYLSDSVSSHIINRVNNIIFSHEVIAKK